jgi:hypothetical protein
VTAGCILRIGALGAAINPQHPTMNLPELPHLDEHATEIAAGVDMVWPALLATVERAFNRAGAPTYARLVGCAPLAASGPRPLGEGSTIPGFRVAAAMPNEKLALVGRHRFASYALIFRLEAIDAHRSRIRAESRALFPGISGRIYRALVIGTSFHVVAVRRILAATRRRATAAAAGASPAGTAPRPA